MLRFSKWRGVFNWAYKSVKCLTNIKTPSIVLMGGELILAGIQIVEVPLNPF